MYFVNNISVPANTTKDNPLVKTMELSAGWVSHIRIGFPAGCAGLVGVQVRRFDSQVLPLTMGEWITYNDYVFECPVWVDLRDDPMELVLHLYNEDDTFPHEIAVHVIVEEHNLIAEGFGPPPEFLFR